MHVYPLPNKHKRLDRIVPVTLGLSAVDDAWFDSVSAQNIVTSFKREFCDAKMAFLSKEQFKVLCLAVGSIW